MSDKQKYEENFRYFYKALTKDEILGYLGQFVRSVKCQSGNSYAIKDIHDLMAMVEQELYEYMEDFLGFGDWSPPSESVHFKSLLDEDDENE